MRCFKEAVDFHQEKRKKLVAQSSAVIYWGKWRVAGTQRPLQLPPSTIAIRHHSHPALDAEQNGYRPLPGLHILRVPAPHVSPCRHSPARFHNPECRRPLSIGRRFEGTGHRTQPAAGVAEGRGWACCGTVSWKLFWFLLMSRWRAAGQLGDLQDGGLPDLPKWVRTGLLCLDHRLL